MNKEMFYVGQMFSCKEEVLCFYREFCRMHSQPLTIRNSSEEKVVFKCRHGRKRKSMCTGQRPNQHYLFKNCMAQVNVRKSKQNYWHVTKVHLEHNHEIGKVQYIEGRKRELDQQDNNSMPDLVDAEAKDSKIAGILQKKNEKFLTKKDIQNIKNKLFSLSSKEKEAELKNFLIKVAEENGRCMISYNNRNTVEALFIATGVMIDCLKKSQPQVIQINESFGFDIENYKLLGFCYYSSVTGRSEFAALAFIVKGTLGIIKDCLEKFKQICVNHLLVFLIDKDFTGISAIRDVFPLSKILLCKFHVLLYIKKLLSSAFACHSSTKESIFKMFKEVLYSQTEEEYEERKMDLLIIADEVEVMAGNKYVPFRDQFNNNWDSCKEMWVHCYTKNLPLMKDSSKDKIERSFWTLKNYIDKNFCGASSICESIVGLVDFVNKRLCISITNMTQEVFKIINKNPKIKTLLDSASLRLNETGLKLLHESLVSLEALKCAKPGNKKEVLATCHLHDTSIKFCNCEFWKSKKAPCQHILLLRDVLKVELCLEDCFHKRYFVTENTQDDLELMEIMSVEDTPPNNVNICEDMGSDNKMKISTDIEKFKKVSAVTQEINEIISSLDTEKFWEYIDELKNFIKLVREGKSVTLISQPPQNRKSSKGPESPESSILDQSQNFSLKFQEKIKCKGRPKRKSKS